MPSSQIHQISTIVELIGSANPSSLLDIGAGFGKYGVLAREYLELHESSWRKPNWKCRIDGIEAFGEYLSDLHQFVYNHVYVGNALEVIPSLKEHYDLILVIDVLEHFSFDDGVELLKACLGIAGNVLVSTPLEWYAQEDLFGNPYEIHKSHWKRKDFKQFGPHFFMPDPISLICFMGRDSGRLGKEFAGLRRKIKTWFPLAAYAYRWSKRALNAVNNNKARLTFRRKPED
jgi:hypothetical protein